MKQAVTVFAFVAGFYLLCLGANMGFDIEHQKAKTASPALAASVPKSLKRDPIIRLHDKDSGNFFCSGTVVSNHTIVTAAHCVMGYPREAAFIEIRSPKNKSFNPPIYVSVLGANERTDQAMLYGDFRLFEKMEMEIAPQPIIDSFYRPDNNIILCGYPYGGKLLCQPFKHPRQYAFQVQGESHVYPGMSGGPVFDLHTNKIVAVNTAANELYVIVSPLTEIFEALGIPK
jgi:hypothetical protein